MINFTGGENERRFHRKGGPWLTHREFHATKEVQKEAGMTFTHLVPFILLIIYRVSLTKHKKCNTVSS